MKKEKEKKKRHKSGSLKLSSIRAKLIMVFSILFIASLIAIIAITGWQTRMKTENQVIGQTQGVVKELNSSVQLFLEQYEKSLNQYSVSNVLKNYSKAQLDPETDAVQDTELYADIQSDFNNYLGLYEEATSIYVASPNKELKIVPAVDLPADFDPTSRDWYKAAVDAKSGVVWSEPYIDTATEEYIITASKAVVADNKIIGVIGVDVNLTRLTDRVADMELGYEGYPFLFGLDGTAIVHPTMRGENLSDLPFIKKMLDSEKKEGTIHYELDGEKKVLVYNTVPKTNWKVGSAYERDALLQSSKEIERMLILTGGAALVVMLVMVAFVSNKMTQPIKQLQKTVTEVATGDLSIQTTIKSKDETGLLAADLNKMIESMRGTLKVVQESVWNVRQSAESLSAVSEETNASSEEMATVVSEIAHGAQQSASDSEQAHQKSELLGTRINEVYDQSKVMADMAGKADEINQTGMHQVKELVNAYHTSNEYISSMEKVIGSLESKVKTIESVMETITDISAQTNLLALNASIEAARAGEHGKGFAVVADEVRKLADQSVRATEQVKSTINEIQQGSNQAVDEMAKTKETFEVQFGVIQNTNEVFDQTSALMKTMQNEIEKMYEQIRQINLDKDEVVNVIQLMASTAEQTSASCEEMNASSEEQLRAIHSVTQAAEQLTDLSQELQDSIERFKIQ
ncbi:methyl-accepting chemotaxis protein [Rossellomorea aquimaris]|uniref:methyl-accepting chemotaxis protein n=1 Tax=Rossellomorea aquimaris TaxID=189382 RepID=UPI001CD78D64|nr:methyl-accepting chemotaxis protein [Rossellomorea aquimaris]MCA1054900.1 methyl-accepting chemotaxis protein [Rossellomorea aquimaris]